MVEQMDWQLGLKRGYLMVQKRDQQKGIQMV
jgi:hypothetical protein